MTVGELLKVFEWCVALDIVVREEGCGQWIQGYVIGDGVTIGKSYLNYGEDPHMEKGEIRDIGLWKMPKTYMNIPVSKAPESILALKVCEARPSTLHSYSMGYRSNCNEHDLHINCYPEGYEEVERIVARKMKRQKKTEHEQITWEAIEC